MIAFRCPGCQTVHRVEDTLSGSRFACPQCEKVMMVPRAAVAAPPAPTAPPPPVEPLPRSESAAIMPVNAPAPAPQPQAADSKSSESWYCAVADDRRGPMTERAIYELIDHGVLVASDLVWRQGWKDWQPASNYFDFPRSFRDRSREPSRDDERDDFHLPPKDDTTGRVCGILSIVCGCIAFLFCPPGFGIAGIVLASVSLGTSKKKTLGAIGLTLSIIGMIAGMIIGFLVMTALQRR